MISRAEMLRYQAEMCRALGLDPMRVQRIELVIDVRNLPLVTVNYFPTAEQLKAMNVLTARYTWAGPPQSSEPR